MLVAIPCASKAFYFIFLISCYPSSLCFGPLVTSMHLGLYQRVPIISFMHVYACFLASMLYLHVFLSRSRLFHALCPLWACACRSSGPLACMVASTPLMACWMWPLVQRISMMLVCLIHIFLHSVWWCYACLACFVPPVWLSLLLYIFARLPTNSCMSLFKPTFVLLDTPILFDNMFVCPHLAPFNSLSF